MERRQDSYMSYHEVLTGVLRLVSSLVGQNLTTFVSYSPESINTWAPRMKDVLLRQEDCNVILVDWSKGANPGGSGVNYLQASGNARLVGAQTAELIKFLISNAHGSSGSKSLSKRFYIVGFSLGAHVAGYAGSHLKANGGINLGRITGNCLKGFRKDNPFSKLLPENISDAILKFMAGAQA